MKAAVFNAHWPTLGGGEQLAAGMAVALGYDHDVELLVPEPFDAAEASERLGVDVTPYPQREILPGARAFLDVTGEYDLLVNSSFTNMTANGAARSVYYVHFPVPYPESSAVRRIIGSAMDPTPYRGCIERQTGFWLDEFRGEGAWTKSKARMDLVVPRDVSWPLSFCLDARSWPPGRRPHVDVRIADEPVFSGLLDGRRWIRRSVVGRGVADPIPVQILSDAFVPRLVLGTDDDRELGVIVSHARLGRPFGRLAPRYLHGGVSVLVREGTEFLDSYDVIVANSEYTAECVQRLWSRRATVLSPPVLMRETGAKRPIILSVGRFFPSVSGHSKKQLELVQAFRLACERGLHGWELHLVGGCKPQERGYVEDVRRAAVGLPVQFHVNAPGDDVAELFATARLFWHAAGLGEDLARHPDRAEHFGITVVEAMSAGAVPLVFAHGGPAAIVHAHACGLVYSSIEELAEETLRLVRTPDELDRLADAATRAAGEYAFDRFVARTRELFASVASLPGTPARG
jgi:glycosyltransferase involved in cell wall biosynthesis